MSLKTSKTSSRGERSRRSVWLTVLAVAAFAAALNASTASATWWEPPAEPTWYWQLSGEIDTSKEVEIYDIDGFESTAKDVETLQNQGKHVVCYIDAGGAETYRADYEEFEKAEALGGYVDGWPEERWINIRKLEAIEPIMKARFEMCAEKGFDAVEPDLIEAFLNETEIEPAITAKEQLTYNEWIAETVHGLGMAVLQKQDGAQSEELVSLYDGALTEECNEGGFCEEYDPYLEAGKPVLNAEYAWKTSQFCVADEEAGIMGARFNLDLDGELFEPCW